MVGVGCGLLRVIRGDLDCIAEMVPVDLVVNSMIAISYKTAKTKRTDADPKLPFSHPQVYNFVSSPQNPIRWREFTDIGGKRGKEIPPEKSIWYHFFITFKNPILYYLAAVLLHYLPALLVDSVAVLTGRKPQ